MGLQIETADSIYDICFQQMQIEITGRCNMRCQHCRASNLVSNDMPFDQVMKLVKFVNLFGSEERELVISGGEPLLHRDFTKILQAVREAGIAKVSLTTNGWFLTKEHVQLIKKLNFDWFNFSVSVDSVDPDAHDGFRRTNGAFIKAKKALELLTQEGVVHSVRATIMPHMIGNMAELVEFAKSMGCELIGFSAVHPAGRAIERPDLWMNKAQKRTFIEEVTSLNDRFDGINVGTTDPLKCLLCGETAQGEDLVLDGCGAGLTSININSDGVMTPCALLDIPIMNTFPLTVEEMTEQYQNSPLVRNLLMRNFTGKCGQCSRKYSCGGCRARAYVQNGDYLAEDPHCWR